MHTPEVMTETADHTKPVETTVTVRIGAWDHTFSVWCNRTVAETLRHDDWMEGKRRLQSTMDGACMALLNAGVMPSTHFAELNSRAEAAMRTMMYEAFRERNAAKGNLTFQVDSLLKGKEYRV